uniref:Uncharacterized protein n=1 Tax=Rhizophora mucronata TaxID=61149 RepID=A0A2P2JAT7_RHIMU
MSTTFSVVRKPCSNCHTHICFNCGTTNTCERTNKCNTNSSMSSLL